MASIEPLVQINVVNLFKQLHETALKQAKLPQGFVLKNLAFADEKAKEMKAGEYLITVAPEDEKDDKLFLDDKTRPQAEDALKTYIKFFVNKDVDPKEFAEIKVSVQDSGTDDKDKKEESPAQKKEETPNKPAGESYKINSTRNNLLNELFDDYSLGMITEEGEDDKKEEPAGDEKKDNAKEPEKDDSLPKATEKVRGLSAKYTCELAGEKTGTLAGALKKGAKSLLGGVWSDLTQIKITGGVFGKDGLAVGKVLDPDAWKETLGRPDIDANTIKSDIDTVMKKDYTNTTAVVDVHKCTEMMTLLKKADVKIPGELRKKMSDADMCIGIKIDKDDNNYDSYNEESIAEVINKSIGNYYKSIITHPLKFKVSKDDIFKIENYSDTNKKLGPAKDKQTPHKESMSFLQYCVFVDTGKILLEDVEDTGDKTEAAEIDKSKISEVKEKFQDNIETRVDAKQVDINSISTDYDYIQKIKNKVKKLQPTNAQDFDKIENVEGTAFFADIAIKEKVNASNTVEYSSLLKKLFETQYLSEADEIQNTQESIVVKAIIDTAEQMQKKDAKETDLEPVAFNYKNEDNSSSKSTAAGESMQHNELKLLKFIYEELSEDELAEAHSQKKTDQKKLNKVKELIKSKLDIIRSKYDGKKDEFIKYVYSDQGQQLAWTKGDEAENNKFNRFIDLLFSDKPADEVAKDVAALTSKQNFRNDIIYRFIAPIEKLEREEEKEEKVKITFYDANPETGEKDGDPLKTIEIAKGTTPNEGDNGTDVIPELNKKLGDNKKDGYTFKGWNPSVEEKADEDTDIVAKYIEDDKKDDKYTVMFQYAPNQEKPDDTEIIQVDGKDEQEVLAGEAAKAPEHPEIEGWQPDGWDTDEWQNVKDDLVVLAKYKKPSITITFKVPKNPAEPDGDMETVGDPIEFEDGKPIEPPTPPDHTKEGYEFEKWDPDPKELKPEESTDVIGTYKKKDEEEKTSSTLHEVYIVIDKYNLANAAKMAPESYYIYKPIDPAKLGDTKKDGRVDVENGKYELAQKEPIEKTDDDSFNDAVEKLIPKEYTGDNPKDGYAYDGVQEVKKPKDGKPGIMVMTFKNTKGETFDLYLYVSKKIKYKNEKTVGRKEKKMMNGNAYNT